MPYRMIVSVLWSVHDAQIFQFRFTLVVHAMKDASLYGDNILGIDLIEFFLLALTFIRMS